MSSQKDTGFSAEERAAMKERAREMKAAAEGLDNENAALAKIAELPEPWPSGTCRPALWSADHFRIRFEALGMNIV